MNYPHCKKEIDESNYYSFNNYGKVMINCFIPIMIVESIGMLIDNIFKIDLIQIWMVLMIVVGVFYMIYGLLFEFKKVKGRLFITNLFEKL